jgi:hypothetical protein
VSEANKQLARRWFEEVWNQRSEAAIDAMYAPGGKSYGFPDADSVLVGPEAFKAVHRNFAELFPTCARPSKKSSPKATVSPSAGASP